MKFFIDTANVNEIKKAWEVGVVDGVTTNPSLISKEGRDPIELLKEICGIVDGPCERRGSWLEGRGNGKRSRIPRKDT